MRVALVLAAVAWATSAIAETTHQVYVTRKGQDLYEVAGKNIRLKTMACFEYASFAEATLQLLTYSGISTGEITFSDSGAKCYVKEVVR